MNMNDETQAPVSGERNKKGFRVSRGLIYGGPAIAVAVVLGGYVKLGTLALTDLDSRLVRLESRNGSVVTTEQLSALQADVKALQTGLAEGKQRVTELQAQVTAKAAQGEDTVSLRQALESFRETQQSQASQLKALTEQLKTLSLEPVASQVKKTTEKKTPAVSKPAALNGKPRPARRATPVARNAPFVLTGIERRGAESWAAVAPKGYSSLSQIALVGEGEAVAGWTLVRAGYGEATFRVNGRLTALKVE